MDATEGSCASAEAASSATAIAHHARGNERFRALLAVVTYQVISTYLPALPGLIAYVDLRRRMKTWGPEPAGEPVAAT